MMLRQLLLKNARLIYPWLQVMRKIDPKNLPSSDLLDTWKSKKIPKKQWKTVAVQLNKFNAGEYVAEFEVLVEAIRTGIAQVDIAKSKVLEVGCSSGYYGQVLNSSFSNFHYTGVDFSEAFVQFGKKKFRRIDLAVADTRKLPFENKEFGIVISGSVLLHVFEWELGLQESCRVAQSLVVLHRTPVSTGETTLHTKSAYGVNMFQWVFNENQLIREMLKNGFTHIWSQPVYKDQICNTPTSSPSQFTYLFKRLS